MRYENESIIIGLLRAIIEGLFETFAWAFGKWRDPEAKPRDKPSVVSLIGVFVVAVFLIAIIVGLLVLALYAA